VGGGREEQRCGRAFVYYYIEHARRRNTATKIRKKKNPNDLNIDRSPRLDEVNEKND